MGSFTETTTYSDVPKKRAPLGDVLQIGVRLTFTDGDVCDGVMDADLLKAMPVSQGEMKYVVLLKGMDAPSEIPADMLKSVEVIASIGSGVGRKLDLLR